MTTTERPGSASSPPTRRIGFLTWIAAARAVVLFAFLLLALLWVAFYPQGDLDDKAAHYYSAARLYADRAHADAVEKARASWLSRLSPSVTERNSQCRTDSRLSNFANYVIPSSVTRLFIEFPRRSPESPPTSFAAPVRAACLLLYVLGLLGIVAITWRDPMTSAFLMVCLAAEAAGTSLMWLADRPISGMQFMAWVPRGSALLILTGAFASFQQKRRAMACAFLALLFGWHFWLAVILVPIAVAALGIHRAQQASSRRTRFILVGMLVALGAAVSTGAPDAPALMHLWIPLLLVSGLLITSLRSPSPAAALPASFLFLSQTVSIAFANPTLAARVSAWTGSPLIGELPVRLSGATHLAAVVLTSVLCIAVLDMVAPRWTGLTRRLRLLLAAAAALIVFGGVCRENLRFWMIDVRGVAAVVLLLVPAAVCLDAILRQWTQPARRRGILLAAAVAVLSLVCWNFRSAEQAAVQGRGAFFENEDTHVVRHRFPPESLDQLDPRDEPVFFASLGDFLLLPLPKRAGTAFNPAAPPGSRERPAPTDASAP